jgi:hypothetical protein
LGRFLAQYEDNDSRFSLPSVFQMMSPIPPLKIPVCALLLSSGTLFGQPFSFQKDEAGEIVHASVNNDDISARQLKEVAGIKSLKFLELGWGPEGVGLEKGALSVLADCRLLEYLQLAKFHLRDEELEVLLKLKALKVLSIEAPDLTFRRGSKTEDPTTDGLTDKSIETLGALEALEELVIRGEHDFSDEFARKVSTLPKLTVLEVSSKRFSDGALEAIAANPRLKRLTIRSPRFTDSGVQALARMQALEELEIHSSRLTKKSLHAIAPLAGLKVLELPIKEVDREALAVVAGLKAMERLILRSAEIGDDQFEALKGHPSLNSLFLESAALTEKSEVVLQSLTALKYGELGKESWIRRVTKK